MNAETILQVLETALRPVVELGGGRLEMASDPDHVLEILCGSAPKRWRVILNYAGEEPVDPDNASGIRILTVACTVQASRGFQIQPGRHVFRETPAGRDSLLHLSDDIDRLFRGFSGTAPNDLDCRGFKFAGRQWLSIENIPTRQLTTNFRIKFGNDLPTEADEIALIFP